MRGLNWRNENADRISCHQIAEMTWAKLDSEGEADVRGSYEVVASRTSAGAGRLAICKSSQSRSCHCHWPNTQSKPTAASCKISFRCA